MTDRPDTIDWLDLVLQDVDRFNQLIVGLPIEQRTMFVGADLSDLDLSQVRFAALDLTNANLSGSTVPGYGLATCRLQGTRLDGVSLDNEYWRSSVAQIQALWAGRDHWTQRRSENNDLVLLNEANLSGADFEQFDLRKTSFTSSRLLDVRFAQTDLNHTELRAAHIDRSTLDTIECRRLVLIDATATETTWTDVAISDSDFTGADLTGSRFERCTFRNVIFNDAVMVGARFDRCTFVRCLFYDADLSNSVLHQCTFEASDVSNGDITDVVIS
jgi:uncharacterized protein YjbI with pentapeptide repeats